MKNSLNVFMFLITLFFTSFVVPPYVGLGDEIYIAKVKAASVDSAPIAGATLLLNSYYIGKQATFESDEDVSDDIVTLNNEPTYQIYDVPEYSGFKSWMSYNLFGEKTDQYKLQQIAYTGKYGIRYVDDYACIAIGTFADTEIGQRIDLVLKNGTIIQCVMADEKADKHTDSNNMITTKSDCCSEFIVDKKALDKTAKRAGDMSSVCEEWDSPVAQFYIYEENLLK